MERTRGQLIQHHQAARRARREVGYRQLWDGNGSAEVDEMGSGRIDGID